MARTVLPPDGSVWRVAIEWEATHLRRVPDQAVRPVARFLLRREMRAAARKEREQRERLNPKKNRWYDYFDLPADEGCLVALPIIVAIVLLIWFGPILIAFLFGLVDVTLVVLGVVLVGLWRIVARRPWSVVAFDNKGTALHWTVVGVRRARHLVGCIAEQLERGAPLECIETDLRVTAPAVNPADENVDPLDPALAARSWRAVFKSFGAIVLAVAIVIGLWLWLRPDREPTVRLRAIAHMDSLSEPKGLSLE